MRAAFVLSAALASSAFAAWMPPAGATPPHVACTLSGTDPRVTVDEAIDVVLDAGVLRSLRWTTDRTVRDAASESHAFACKLTIDDTNATIGRTRRGSAAVLNDDRDCRIEVLGNGSRLALLPRCHAACTAEGDRLTALAIDTETGMCRRLDERFPTGRAR